MNTAVVKLWPAMYKQFLGRNFAANQMLTHYHSTLGVLKSILGNSVVECAATIAQEQLWLNDMTHVQVDWKQQLSGAVNVEAMLAAQTELLATLKKKRQELYNHTMEHCSEVHITSVPELESGDDARVHQVVEQLVGENIWKMNQGGPFDGALSMSVESLDGAMGEGEAIAPYWVPDDECDECTFCGQAFTWTRRRHHCRGCGKIFCDKCSGKEGHVPWRNDGPHRMCNNCHETFSSLSPSRPSSP